MAIRVGNVRDYIRGGKPVLPENAAYVGRAVKRYGLKRSPLANPYRIGVDRMNMSGRRMDRRDTISAYVWLLGSLPMSDAPVNSAIGHELSRIRDLASKADIILLCWCHPKPCHADVIREYLEAHCPATLQAAVTGKTWAHLPGAVGVPLRSLERGRPKPRPQRR